MGQRLTSRSLPDTHLNELLAPERSLFHSQQTSSLSSKHIHPNIVPWTGGAPNSAETGLGEINDQWRSPRTGLLASVVESSVCRITFLLARDSGAIPWELL
jgi:hypothetical protein